MSAAKKVGNAEDNKLPSPVDDKLRVSNYQRELRRLHIELVKLQQWVMHKGASRSASSSRGVTAPARAARSRRSPSVSVRAYSASWHFPHQPSARRQQLWHGNFTETKMRWSVAQSRLRAMNAAGMSSVVTAPAKLLFLMALVAARC